MTNRIATGAFILLTGSRLFAGNLDTIGVTRLRAAQPALDGSGILVTHPEAGNGLLQFEVAPAAVGRPESLFTWISPSGSTNQFPNDVGAESGHADQVGNIFYGPNGVATNVSHVDNYDADYFLGSYVRAEQSTPGLVVNQSFVDPNMADQSSLDTSYDDYVTLYGTIFCSSVGDGGGIYPPATAYNSMGVGSYGIGTQTSVGPTSDGRSKPDLVAPAPATSYSSPYVSGAAAVLLQAVNRGDAGAGASAARDARTMKAVLLNGAIKPYNWSHTPTAPLDTQYGAGVLNIYYSYAQLAAGQHAPSAANSSSQPLHSSPISSLLGWDQRTLTGVLLNPAVNHYCFTVTNGPAFTFTATLVWELTATSLNQLTLSLYNFTDASLVAQSVSAVDNVQCLYVAHLPPGQYDLQVARSSEGSDVYSVAYQFFPIAPLPLSIQAQGTALTVSWPATPTIYTLQQAASLTAPISWSTAPAMQLLTNGDVVVSLSAGTSPNFYRLIR